MYFICLFRNLKLFRIGYISVFMVFCLNMLSCSSPSTTEFEKTKPEGDFSKQEKRANVIDTTYVDWTFEQLGNFRSVPFGSTIKDWNKYIAIGTKNNVFQEIETDDSGSYIGIVNKGSENVKISANYIPAISVSNNQCKIIRINGVVQNRKILSGIDLTLSLDGSFLLSYYNRINLDKVNSLRNILRDFLHENNLVYVTGEKSTDGMYIIVDTPDLVPLIRIRKEEYTDAYIYQNQCTGGFYSDNLMDVRGTGYSKIFPQHKGDTTITLFENKKTFAAVYVCKESQRFLNERNVEDPSPFVNKMPFKPTLSMELNYGFDQPIYRSTNYCLLIKIYSKFLNNINPNSYMTFGQETDLREYRRKDSLINAAVNH